MIVQFSGEYSRDEFAVCPRAPSTVAELRLRMLQRAKAAEGSYAYQLISGLHSAVFLQSLDFKADYAEYFACEYESFGEYLRRRARLTPETVATLVKEVDAASGVYHFRPEYEFLADAFGLEFLSRLLEDPPPGETS